MNQKQKNFDELLKNKKLVISLIGMSNMGKTYWSKKLASIGFVHINCDDLIEQKLDKELKKYGYKGIKDVSRWMGQPYEKRFKRNQAIYLSLEKEIMKKILGSLEKDKNIIIDTTGSVIYTGNEIYKKLRKSSLVVYIKASQKMQGEMFQNYIKNPKPVVFGRVFKKDKKESNFDALGKSYKRLLKERSLLYKKYANVTLPREKIAENLTPKNFISLIKN